MELMVICYLKNNTEELADRIIELLKDDKKRALFGENAFFTVLKEANIENMVHKMNLALTIKNIPIK